MKIANPLPKSVDGKNPRRCQEEHWADAEKAIFAAVQAVNALGQDSVLGQAITMLGQAKERVSDFLEGAGDEPPPADAAE